MALLGHSTPQKCHLGRNGRLMVGGWVVAAGVLLLAYTAWSWAGRTPRARAWARKASWPSMILGLFPGLGLVLLGSGLAALLPEPVVGYAAPVLLAGFALFAMGLVYMTFRPRWWGPRWYRTTSHRKD